MSVFNIHISVDIETDGLVPGRNNMLSLGAAALETDEGRIVDTFKYNFSTVGDLLEDPSTMAWWKRFPEAYKRARENAQPPQRAITAFVDWVQENTNEKSVVFAWKPHFDLAFVRYYIHRFHKDGAQLCEHSIFGRGQFGLDLKTLAALALKQRFHETKVSNIPSSLKIDELGNPVIVHTHDALEDAIEQAYVFYNACRRLGVTL